jgi:hypothetical protein
LTFFLLLLIMGIVSFMAIVVIGWFWFVLHKTAQTHRAHAARLKK